VRGNTNWRACGAVKARRIYGWTWRNIVVHEKKNETHQLEKEERGRVCRNNVDDMVPPLGDHTLASLFHDWRLKRRHDSLIKDVLQPLLCQR